MDSPAARPAELQGGLVSLVQPLETDRVLVRTRVLQPYCIGAPDIGLVRIPFQAQHGERAGHACALSHPGVPLRTARRARTGTGSRAWPVAAAGAWPCAFIPAATTTTSCARRPSGAAAAIGPSVV